VDPCAHLCCAVSPILGRSLLGQLDIQIRLLQSAFQLVSLLSTYWAVSVSLRRLYPRCQFSGMPMKVDIDRHAISRWALQLRSRFNPPSSNAMLISKCFAFCVSNLVEFLGPYCSRSSLQPVTEMALLYKPIVSPTFVLVVCMFGRTMLQLHQ